MTGSCADDRMMSAMDFVLSKALQAECTWTGTSRKGPKTAIMPFRQFIQLFKIIGRTKTEIVTEDKVMRFFMKKLKNANKRLQNLGLRRSSNHVFCKRRRRKTADLDEEEEEDDDHVDNANDGMDGDYGDYGDNGDTVEGYSEMDDAEGTAADDQYGEPYFEWNVDIKQEKI